MKIQTVLGAAALCVALSGAAAAQQNQTTVTKNFDDWTVRCYAVESQSPCDMIEVLANNTTKQRVLSVSIAYVPSVSRHTLQIGVPLGVSLAKGIVLTAGDYKSAALKYRRCDVNGCYVELVIDDAVIQGLSRANTATAQVADGDGKIVPINFSLKGFSAAHDEMADLARQKAKTPPAAPADAPKP